MKKISLHLNKKHMINHFLLLLLPLTITTMLISVLLSDLRLFFAKGIQLRPVMVLSLSLAVLEAMLIRSLYYVGKRMIASLKIGDLIIELGKEEVIVHAKNVRKSIKRVEIYQIKEERNQCIIQLYGNRQIALQYFNPIDCRNLIKNY